MKKVMIIGSAGSGKSTFGRRLRELTGLPLYHLDMIWHKPDKTTVSREEFDASLTEILDTDEFIIDGNYSRTLEVRFRHCDTVFLLDYPTELCLEGARSRIGTKRDDLPWLETEFNPEFHDWIANFRDRTLPKIYALIEKYRDVREIVVFKTRKESDEYLERLKKQGEG